MPEQRTVEDALAPHEQHRNQQRAEHGKPPLGQKAQIFGQHDKEQRSDERARADRRAAEDHGEHEVDRPLEAEIARFDVDMMMREQAAGNRGDRRAETKRANLDGRGVETDEGCGGFVVMHGAQFEPDLRTLQDRNQQQDAGAQVQM